MPTINLDDPNVLYRWENKAVDSTPFPVAELTFGRQRIEFCMSARALATLERATGVSISALYVRVAGVDAKHSDAEMIIREALHASGYGDDAEDMIEEHMRGRPLAEFLPIANAILGVALFGQPKPAAG